MKDLCMLWYGEMNGNHEKKWIYVVAVWLWYGMEENESILFSILVVVLMYRNG